LHCLKEYNFKGEKKERPPKPQKEVQKEKPAVFSGWSWSCGVCNEDFADLTAVYQHQDTKKHAKASCFCGVKNLSNSELREHKTTSNHWKCDRCDSCFSSESACLAHVRSQSHFNCEYCGKQFVKEEGVLNHLKSLLGRGGHNKIKHHNVLVSAESESEEESEEEE
jgi:transposase-like protein